MEYYIYDIKSKFSQYYYYKDYKFDYIPIDSISKFNIKDEDIIGYMKVKEIGEEDAVNKIIAPHNIQKHYFKLNLFDEKIKLQPNKVIGYILLENNKYVAIYKKLF